MVKLTGPLFSETAHGEVGGVLTYSKRANVKQVRYQYKIGTSWSEEQLMQQDKFHVCKILWDFLSALDKAAWKFLAEYGWVKVEDPDYFIPVGDGGRLARRHINRHLPKLNLNKGVPKTGQTIEYKQGDDGTYQAGIKLETPRFHDNKDGTITDRATELDWVADPSQLGGAFGSPGTPAKMSIDEGCINCKNLNYAGHNDWRLPNRIELESLIDSGKNNPCIDESKFPNTQNDVYLTSSISRAACVNTWLAYFSVGEVKYTYGRNKAGYARPVRSKALRKRLYRPRAPVVELRRRRTRTRKKGK